MKVVVIVFFLIQYASPSVIYPKISWDTEWDLTSDNSNEIDIDIYETSILIGIGVVAILGFTVVCCYLSALYIIIFAVISICLIALFLAFYTF